MSVLPYSSKDHASGFTRMGRASLCVFAYKSRGARYGLWLLLCFFILPAASAQDTLSVLVKRLKDMPQVSRITPLETQEFNEKYEFFITQPLDHSRPDAGTFLQRVVLSHLGFDRPTLLVTEGYGARYALQASYREELSRLFDMNILFVEHRYFLESTPSPLNWEYLTVENSAFDLHTVTTAFRSLYPEKWGSTGVSKGGQTTLFYRAFFPEDVDFSVAYVAPLNRSVEDGRHEPFLRKVGTAEARRKIKEFQLTMWKQKEAFLPDFTTYCRENNLRFHRPVDQIYDFCLLEYPFAFWQWGTPVDQIPDPDAEPSVLLDHLLGLCEPSYFSYESQYRSFFVQAVRELGYYGYDTKPFKKYLSIKTSKDYLRKLMLPRELESVPFHKGIYHKTHQFLLKNDPKLICIYGEVDPWTASGVTDPSYYKNKQNFQVYIQPSGSHRARIHTLPEEMQQQIIRQIREWLE